MNHEIAMKLGQAAVACELARQQLYDLTKFSFNQVSKDFIGNQLMITQDRILEAADLIDKEKE